MLEIEKKGIQKQKNVLKNMNITCKASCVSNSDTSHLQQYITIKVLIGLF